MKIKLHRVFIVFLFFFTFSCWNEEKCTGEACDNKEAISLGLTKEDLKGKWKPIKTPQNQDHENYQFLIEANYSGTYQSGTQRYDFDSLKIQGNQITLTNRPDSTQPQAISLYIKSVNETKNELKLSESQEGEELSWKKLSGSEVLEVQLANKKANLITQLNRLSCSENPQVLNKEKKDLEDQINKAENQDQLTKLLDEVSRFKSKLNGFCSSAELEKKQFVLNGILDGLHCDIPILENEKNSLKKEINTAKNLDELNQIEETKVYSFMDHFIQICKSESSLNFIPQILEIEKARLISKLTKLNCPSNPELLSKKKSDLLDKINKAQTLIDLNGVEGQIMQFNTDLGEACKAKKVRNLLADQKNSLKNRLEDILGSCHDTDLGNDPIQSQYYSLKKKIEEAQFIENLEGIEAQITEFAKNFTQACETEKEKNLSEDELRKRKTEFIRFIDESISYISEQTCSDPNLASGKIQELINIKNNANNRGNLYEEGVRQINREFQIACELSNQKTNLITQLNRLSCSASPQVLNEEKNSLESQINQANNLQALNALQAQIDQFNTDFNKACEAKKNEIRLNVEKSRLKKVSLKTIECELDDSVRQRLNSQRENLILQIDSLELLDGPAHLTLTDEINKFNFNLDQACRAKKKEIELTTKKEQLKSFFNQASCEKELPIDHLLIQRKTALLSQIDRATTKSELPDASEITQFNTDLGQVCNEARELAIEKAELLSKLKPLKCQGMSDFQSFNLSKDNISLNQERDELLTRIHLAKSKSELPKNNEIDGLNTKLEVACKKHELTNEISSIPSLVLTYYPEIDSSKKSTMNNKVEEFKSKINSASDLPTLDTIGNNINEYKIDTTLSTLLGMSGISIKKPKSLDEYNAYLDWEGLIEKIDKKENSAEVKKEELERLLTNGNPSESFDKNEKSQWKSIQAKFLNLFNRMFPKG